MIDYIVMEIGLEWVALGMAGVALILIGIALVSVGRESRRPATYREVYDTGEIRRVELGLPLPDPYHARTLAPTWRQAMEAAAEIERRGAANGRHRHERLEERTRRMPEDLWG